MEGCTCTHCNVFSPYIAMGFPSTPLPPSGRIVIPSAPFGLGVFYRSFNVEFILRKIAMRQDLLDCDKAEQIARAMIVWDNPYADDKNLNNFWLEKAYEYLATLKLMQ